MSETFQSGELNFSRIKPAIEKTTQKIKDLAEKQKCLTELKQDLASHHIHYEKELSAENEQQVKLYTEKYAESIIGNIHAHFPEDMLCWDHFQYSMLKTFLVAVIVKNLKYMVMRAFTF